MRAIRDRTGERYGRLVAVEISSSSKNNIRWLCKCDCGNTINISSRNLGSPFGKGVKSCGCLIANSLTVKGIPRKDVIQDREVAILKQDYNSSVKTKNNNLYTDSYLSFDDFVSLVRLPCYYCGASASKVIKDRTSNFAIAVNSIGRFDISKGFSLDNSISCCVFCNRAKNGRAIEEYLDWVRLIKNTQGL